MDKPIDLGKIDYPRYEVVFQDKIPIELPMQNVFPTQTFANDQPEFKPLWR